MLATLAFCLLSHCHSCQKHCSRTLYMLQLKHEKCTSHLILHWRMPCPPTSSDQFWCTGQSLNTPFHVGLHSHVELFHDQHNKWFCTLCSALRTLVCCHIQ